MDQTASQAKPFVPSGASNKLSTAHAGAHPFVPPSQVEANDAHGTTPNATAQPFIPSPAAAPYVLSEGSGQEEQDEYDDSAVDVDVDAVHDAPHTVPVQYASQVQQQPPVPSEYLFDTTNWDARTADDGNVPLGSFFASEPIRAQLQQISLAEHAVADASVGAFAQLPESIHRFHTLLPLEQMAQPSSSPVLGIRSLVIKGTSSADGRTYAIRRLDPQQVPPSNDTVLHVKQACKRWNDIGRANPHLATFRGVFVSSELYSVPAVHFLHDYHAGAVTLRELFMQAQPDAVSEGLLWCFATQFATLLHAVHRAGIACRAIALAPSKVLVTAAYRLRLSSVGVVDVITRTMQAVEKSEQSLAAEDLMSVGHLLLCIACQSEGRPSMKYCEHVFSAELTDLIRRLMRAGHSADGTFFLNKKH